MQDKPPQKKKLDKISQVSQVVTQGQTHQNKNNRISLSSVTAHHPERKNIYTTIKEDESSLSDKEKKIKQLQEAIMDKKQKNDAIQEAFLKRKESTNFFKKDEFPQLKLAIIGEGLKKVVSQHISFKKALLKVLITASAIKQKNEATYAKLILVWLIGWLSRMFNLLGQSTSK